MVVQADIKADSFVQISMIVERDHAENVTEILQSSGAISVSIASANEQECFDVATPGEPRWIQQRLSALFYDGQSMDLLAEQLTRRITSPPEFVIERIDDRDWERNWLESYKPMKVGERLWVCPSWCDPVEKDDVNLTIDPGLAFGTGTHETTRLCLEYLASAPVVDKTLIDFGCGSGILGIAAIKLGAQSAIGIDIDPRAVQAALQNAQRNQVEGRFTAISNDQFTVQFENFKADLVIANILEQTLVELSNEISAMVSAGGTMLLSGILEHQTDSVIQAFDRKFEFDRRTDNGWVLLVGRII